MTIENINKFEKVIQEFEKTIEKMNSKEIDIDEAIKLHQEGLEKYKEAQKILDEADQKIEVYRK